MAHGCKTGLSLALLALCTLASPRAQALRHFEPQTAADGTMRYVGYSGDAELDLFVDLNFDPECLGSGEPSQKFRTWTGSWVQADAEAERLFNYCGPVAIRNLLNWYGECVDFVDLGDTMRSASPFDNAETAAALTGICAGWCGAGCVPTGPLFPVCMLGCTPACAGSAFAIVNDIASRNGLYYVGVYTALSAYTPDGYRLYSQAGDPSLDSILRPLSDGNPVVVIYTTGNRGAHADIVTGIYVADDGTTMVRLANAGTPDNVMSWADFSRAWSLVDFGDDLENSIRNDIFGLKPYSVMYYSRDGSPWDRAFYHPGTDCATQYQLNYSGNIAAFVTESGPICHARDFDQCEGDASCPGDERCISADLESVCGCLSDADCSGLDYCDPLPLRTYGSCVAPECVRPYWCPDRMGCESSDCPNGEYCFGDGANAACSPVYESPCPNPPCDLCSIPGLPPTIRCPESNTGFQIMRQIRY